MGIDPGFGRMGWAIVEKNKQGEKLIGADCIETDPKEKHENRLVKIGQELEKIMKKHQPQAIAVEKLFFAKNQKTALRVAQTQGIIFYLASLYNLTVHEFTPLEIKTALCGYGRADKTQVRKMLKMILGLNQLPKLDDASDAIAIALVPLSRAYPQD